MPRFIAADDCVTIFDELLDALPWHQETVADGDETYQQPRLTAWIGEHPYSYSGVSHPPNTEVNIHTYSGITRCGITRLPATEVSRVTICSAATGDFHFLVASKIITAYLGLTRTTVRSCRIQKHAFHVYSPGVAEMRHVRTLTTSKRQLKTFLFSD